MQPLMVRVRSRTLRVGPMRLATRVGAAARGGTVMPLLPPKAGGYSAVPGVEDLREAEDLVESQRQVTLASMRLTLGLAHSTRCRRRARRHAKPGPLGVQQG
jgi:hypothetical protein